jgi:hypothetical protein
MKTTLKMLIAIAIMVISFNTNAQNSKATKERGTIVSVDAEGKSGTYQNDRTGEIKSFEVKSPRVRPEVGDVTEIIVQIAPPNQPCQFIYSGAILGPCTPCEAQFENCGCVIIVEIICP